MMKVLILSAKRSVLSVSLALLMSNAAVAGIPVADGLNLSQTTITALQAVAQVTKQIEQYKTQLEQYENMLANTAAPAAYVWDEVNSTINKLVQAQNSLEYYKNQTGSIDAYLSKYGNVNYYRNSPCFTVNGCTDADRAALADRRAFQSEAVNRTNADVIKTVGEQQSTLASEAIKLKQLQSQAVSADGQMKALQAANQLASAQTNQLLQLRALLTAQSQAAATLAQQTADRQAQQDAASESFRSGSFKKSQAMTW
jgi:P-type conjugative transfer protein TrbJ